MQGGELPGGQVEKFAEDLVGVLTQQWGRFPQSARALVEVRDHAFVRDLSDQGMIEVAVECASGELLVMLDQVAAVSNRVGRNSMLLELRGKFVGIMGHCQRGDVRDCCVDAVGRASGLNMARRR